MDGQWIPRDMMPPYNNVVVLVNGYSGVMDLLMPPWMHGCIDAPMDALDPMVIHGCIDAPMDAWGHECIDAPMDA